MTKIIAHRKFWLAITFFSIIVLILVIFIKGDKVSMASAPTNHVSIANSPCDEKYKEISSLPIEKQKRFEDEYRACLAALTSTPNPNNRKPTDLPNPTREKKETRLRRLAGAGMIIWDVTPKVSPLMFLSTNTWYEKTNNGYIYAFGGSIRTKDGSSDLSQGGILIDVTDLDRESVPGGEIIPTPDKNGPVTIVDAIGEQLTLIAEDGSVLFFNMASRKFVTPSNHVTQYIRQVGNGTLTEEKLSKVGERTANILNQWSKDSEGKQTTVYAGTDRNEESKGLLIISTKLLNTQNATDQTDTYYIDTLVTDLRIFDVKGSLVILVGRNGSEYVFNLSENRFLSNTEIAFLATDPYVAAYEAQQKKPEKPTPTLMFTPDRNQPVLTPYP